MKVVLDTHIWISGLLMPKGPAAKVLQAWEAGQFKVVTSAPLLDEMARVLRYPKIYKRIQWSDEKIEQYVLLLGLLTDCVTVNKPYIKVPRDENDSVILSTLGDSQASYLVTDDDDLLSLKAQYAIISLSDFVALLD